MTFEGLTYLLKLLISLVNSCRVRSIEPEVMSFQQGQGYEKDTKILRSEWRGVGTLTDTVLGSHFCSVFHTLLSTRSYPGIDYRLRLGQFFSGVMGKASHGDPPNPMPGACPSWGLYSFWLMWLFLGSPKPHAVRNVKSGLWDKAGTPVPFLLHIVFYLYKTLSNGPTSSHFILAAKIKFPPWEKKEEV